MEVRYRGLSRDIKRSETRCESGRRTFDRGGFYALTINEVRKSIEQISGWPEAFTYGNEHPLEA